MKPGSGSFLSLRAALVAAAVLSSFAGAARAETFVVDSGADAGPGSLRHAIRSANEAPGSTIRIELGADGLVELEKQLPPIAARGTRLEGGGVTLREAPGCERAGGKKGCDGIVVTGGDVLVRDIKAAGFTFDGIAVRGRKATRVRIEDVECIDNLDDGIGVSDLAGPVTITRAVSMSNGYRTKGKGLLVFDEAEATLRDSVIVANRDGVTITRKGRAVLERVLVIGNYDKGIGLSGGSVRGREVHILANGRAPGAPAPNADGLRLGLSATADLSNCSIAANGDTGVALLDNSEATLRNCRIEANQGPPTAIADTAKLTQR